MPRSTARSGTSTASGCRGASFPGSIEGAFLEAGRGGVRGAVRAVGADRRRLGRDRGGLRARPGAARAEPRAGGAAARALERARKRDCGPRAGAGALCVARSRAR